METITNEIILKTCRLCLLEKDISMFELKTHQCKKCKSLKRNSNKEYYKNKYIEKKNKDYNI